jgi:hypothetical protein
MVYLLSIIYRQLINTAKLVDRFFSTPSKGQELDHSLPSLALYHSSINIPPRPYHHYNQTNALDLE